MKRISLIAFLIVFLSGRQIVLFACFIACLSGICGNCPLLYCTQDEFCALRPWRPGLRCQGDEIQHPIGMSCTA
jgi:hypothetical protein